MKTKREEEKFTCDFCYKKASPDLPPDWDEYVIVCSGLGDQTYERECHLCDECHGAVINKFLKSKIEEQKRWRREWDESKRIQG